MEDQKHPIHQQRNQQIDIELTASDYQLTRGNLEMFTGRWGRNHFVRAVFTAAPNHPTSPTAFTITVDDTHREQGWSHLRGDWPHTTFKSFTKKFHIELSTPLGVGERFFRFSGGQSDVSWTSTAIWSYNQGGVYDGNQRGFHDFIPLEVNGFITSASARIDGPTANDAPVQGLRASLNIKYDILIPTHVIIED